jgi:DNA-binding response OmpR family regulator
MALQNNHTFHPGVILAIEDDLGDVEVLHLALRYRQVAWKVISVSFAKDAIMYLGRVGPYADKTLYPWPTVIVLDLNLPGMSGIEFLTWARKERNLPPIVILSYSASQESRDLAEKLGAKGYFVKSPDLKDTAAMIETLLVLNQASPVPYPNGDACRNPQP